MVDELIIGNEKFIAYEHTCQRVDTWLKKQSIDAIDANELSHFSRLLYSDITELNRYEIQSDGYVIHSLEAAFWCFLTNDNYQQSILKAVNLGKDTDTTAAITGGLAGIYYGYKDIPKAWLDNIARLDDICTLCDELASMKAP